MMPPRAVNSLGKLALPEAALSNSSEVKCWFTAPYTLRARETAMTKSLIDPDGANAELIVKKLNINWGRASTSHLKRILEDADGVGATVLMAVDSAVGKCDVCAVSNKAPHLLVAGAPFWSALNEKVQVDLFSPDALITPHAMGLFSRYSMLVLAPSKNPMAARDAFAASRKTVFGKLRCLRTGIGGGWHSKYGRNIRPQFQGKRAHPQMLARRNGLARGIYNRLREDDRFAGRAIANEVPYPLNAMLKRRGFPAPRIVFGSNPADLYPRQDTGADLDFVQNMSVTSHFTPRWKLGLIAQGAMPTGTANSKLRRNLNRNQSFGRTGIRVGDSAIF